MITKYTDFTSKPLYHISNKLFKEFSLKFIKKGHGVNKQGVGIYLSEDINFIKEYYYEKKKNNYLYTVIIPNNLVFIDYHNQVSDVVFDLLSMSKNSFIKQLSLPFNRKITGEGLMLNIANLIDEPEKELDKLGINGVTYVQDNVRNYCIFNPKNVKILSVEEI